MQGLAMGADDAIIVKSDGVPQTDSLGVAHVLAAAAKRGGFDLILCGTKGADEDQGWAGIALAELLGLPHVPATRHTWPSGATAIIERDVEGGKEKLEVALPAVITSSQSTEPRYPTLKGIMGAKKKKVEEWDIASLGVSTDALKPRVTTLKLEMPPTRLAGKLIEGEPAAQAQTLVKLLREEAKVI